MMDETSELAWRSTGPRSTCPTARGELFKAMARAPYVLTFPLGIAEHTCRVISLQRHLHRLHKVIKKFTDFN